MEYTMDVFYQILSVTGVVLAAAVLFFVIYYFVYKFYINRKILSGEKNQGPVIVSPGVIAVTVGVIICIAAYVMMFLSVSLTAKIAGDIYSSTASLFQMNISDTIENNKKSVAREYSFEAGTVHNDTKTVDLKVTVITDLTLGKEDKLTFRIGDSKTQLVQDKEGNYTGTVQTSVFKEYPTGILTFESDGEKFSEFLSDEPNVWNPVEGVGAVSDDIWTECLPFAELSDTDTAINGNNVETTVKVISYASKSDSNDKFTEMNLVFENDGKAVRTVDLMKDTGVQKDGETYTYHLNDNIGGKGILRYYVSAKDSNGFQYFFRPGNVFHDEGEEAVFSYDNDCKITDKDGNTLKTFCVDAVIDRYAA